MSWSRWVTIISAVSGAISAVAGIANQLPPKWALGITIAALVAASFNERIHGGKSADT